MDHRDKAGDDGLRRGLLRFAGNDVNLAPRRSPLEQRGFFDSSGYNPTGQEAHRKMLSLCRKVIAYCLGGLILRAPQVAASFIGFSDRGGPSNGRRKIHANAEKARRRRAVDRLSNAGLSAFIIFNLLFRLLFSLGFLSFAGEPQSFQSFSIFLKSLLCTLVLGHGFGSLGFPE